MFGNRPSVHLHVVPEFSPGLEGVVAAQTAVSEVDGANGRLIYRGGYLIEDLAPSVTYEEVAYLLWHGDLPGKDDLETLRKHIASTHVHDNCHESDDHLMPFEGEIDWTATIRDLRSGEGQFPVLFEIRNNGPELTSLARLGDVIERMEKLAKEK